MLAFLQGDSGGPLMCLNSQTGNWLLKGLVSFGENYCFLHHKPNVYTDVQFYTDWIESHMVSTAT